MWFFKKKKNAKPSVNSVGTFLYTHIRREFGDDFVFMPEMKRAGEQDICLLNSGMRKDIEEQYRNARITFFESSVYRKIVRLSLNIPTFDSGDREYDSWHDLYLLQDKNGIIRAVYCTGGYRIAHVEGYLRVQCLPKPLERYFADCGETKDPF